MKAFQAVSPQCFSAIIPNLLTILFASEIYVSDLSVMNCTSPGLSSLWDTDLNIVLSNLGCLKLKISRLRSGPSS